MKLSRSILPFIAITISFIHQVAFGESEPLATGQALTQTNDFSNPDDMNRNRFTIGAAVDYSYVVRSDASFPGAQGNSGAQSFSGYLTGAIPVSEKWFVPFGVASRNFYLESLAGAPIPIEIHTLGFDTGLGYRLNDQWTIVGAFGPRLFRLDGIDDADVGIGGMVRATWQCRPNLTLAFGLGFEPDNQVPVLPLAGVKWDVSPDVTLSLMWPRSGVIYHVDRRLDVFIGAGGNFTVFRADHNLGDQIGQSQFDHGLATYRDFHLGIGAEYRILRGLSASVDGGYSVGRQIDYTRIDQTVSFDPAPYVQARLRCRF